MKVIVKKIDRIILLAPFCPFLPSVISLVLSFNSIKSIPCPLSKDLKKKIKKRKRKRKKKKKKKKRKKNNLVAEKSASFSATTEFRGFHAKRQSHPLSLQPKTPRTPRNTCKQ